MTAMNEEKRGGISAETQAAEYFRSKAGFDRLFSALADKYTKLGAFGGRLVLQGLSPDEQEAFGSFFGRSFYGKNRLSLHTAEFGRALAATKYGNCDIKQLVESYLGYGLHYRKEELLLAEQEKNAFFTELLERYEGKPAGKWLTAILDGGMPPWSQISAVYNKNNADTLRARLCGVLDGLDALEELRGLWHPQNLCMQLSSDERYGQVRTYLRLAQFAANITGNPHFFDEGTMEHNWLMHGIAFFQEKHYGQSLTVTEKNELLYRAGIIKDDISNFVTCKGVTGMVAGGEQRALIAEKPALHSHRGLDGFLAENQPVQLTLMNLSAVDTIESPYGEAYVVENPAIFARLAEEAAERTLVCSCGQPNLAVTVLLDKLAASGCKLFYSGDFDPEGLLIADRLKERYGAALELWHFEEQDYRDSISGQTISERRLKQLSKLKDPKLIAAGELLKKSERAGYQERMRIVL